MSLINKRYRRKYLLIIGIITIIFVAYRSFQEGILRYFIFQDKEKQVILEWVDLGPTPDSGKKYAPQGLTWMNGYLIYANTCNDKESKVYKYDPKTMAILAVFNMPKEAAHTSGLAWDGEFLWGVDYISNRAYKIDAEKSFTTGKAHLIGSFDTTLKGTSACCIVEYNGDKLLCISDFRETGINIFVRQEDALKAGTAEGCIVYSYKNEGFSQGLVYDGKYIYESENKLGVDVINRYTLDEAILKGNSWKAILVQYNAPSNSVEDLAWDGEYFWTSDETTFRFYKTKIPDIK